LFCANKLMLERKKENKKLDLMNMDIIL